MGHGCVPHVTAPREWVTFVTMSHAVPAYGLGDKIPLDQLRVGPWGHCVMLMAAVDGAGFDFSDGIKSRVDVGCQMSGCGLICPCTSPSGVVLDPGPPQSLRVDGGAGPSVGALLLSAFPFAFNGFQGQQCIPEPCN